MCHFPGDIVPSKEIIRKRDVGVNNPLPVCMHCFNSNVPLQTSGGSSNVRQKKQQTQEKKEEITRKCSQQTQEKKRKQLENLVSSGKQKV